MAMLCRLLIFLAEESSSFFHAYSLLISCACSLLKLATHQRWLAMKTPKTNLKGNEPTLLFGMPVAL